MAFFDTGNEQNRYAQGLMLERMSDGFVAVDSQWKISYMNAAACRQLLKEEVAAGALLWDVCPGLKDTEFYARCMKLSAADGVQHFIFQNPLSEAITSVTLYPDSDGVTMLLRERALDVQGGEGISDVRVEKLRVAGQLAAGIAHEIRNPLTSLKGFAKLLRNAAGDHVNRYYQIMESEFHRIDMILGELLVLAKPLTASVAPYDLRALVEESAEQLAAKLQQAGIELKLELGTEPIAVNAEKNQLKHVFINLIRNAVEASKTGSAVTVVMSAEAASERVCIRVIDQGIGIAPDMLVKLGEPFFTTKDKGTGLGLMVSFKIIEEHGGVIVFDSKLGEGTVVTVTLPRVL